MNAASPSRPLIAGVVVGLAVLGAGAWLLREARSSAMAATAALEQKKQERDWLARQSPALSPENEAAISADLESAERLLGELRVALQGREAGRRAPPAPAKPIDAFFELADFVEKLRSRAGQAQVVLRPDERFGFATHANEGPPAERIAIVHRQQLAVQYLVDSLLEAHPLALLSVRRERPVAGSSRDAHEHAEDFLEFDRALSLREAGQLEGEAFRVEFTGQTAALRNFLNSLATFRQPVVVRSLEVEPLSAAPANSTVVGSSLPLVKQTLSKFAVTVEFVLLADNPVTLAP